MMKNHKSDFSILAVDLDHTLIDTDMIHLGLRYLLKNKIYLVLILLLLLIFKGKPAAKKYLFENSKIDITKLPYNNDVLDYIKDTKDKYQKIILISGSYYKYVKSVSKFLNLFDDAIGTQNHKNMISLAKVEYIQQRYPKSVFDYIGDSKKDIPIWRLSRKALVVKRGNILKYIQDLDYQVISHIN